MNRLFTLAAGLALIATASALPASAAPAPLDYEIRPYRYTSPAAPARAAAGEVIASHVVSVDGAPWLRLQFDDVRLGPGAQLRITSLRDGAQQHLDAAQLRNWQNTSAYFNGSAVRVELLAGREAAADRVSIPTVMVGQAPQPESQCGPTDDRVASYAPDRARLLNVGCTANLIGDACFITAGHCLSSAFYVNVVEFNVPPSNADGSLNHPGPEDQYVPTSQRDYTDGGVGNDWGVFTVAPNAETGLTPFAAQGSMLAFAPAAPAVGDIAEIIGYGVDSGSANQTQQVHAGPIVEVSGTTLRYQLDTEGGNSGSAVLSGGSVVGIHTHGGCSTNGSGSNAGTLFTHPDLQSAFAAICSGEPPSGPDCGDVVSLRARCTAGFIGTTVRLSSDAFDGQSLTVAIDGDAQTVTIDGAIAKLRSGRYGGGSHTVELLEPGSCGVVTEVSC